MADSSPTAPVEEVVPVAEHATETAAEQPPSEQKVSAPRGRPSKDKKHHLLRHTVTADVRRAAIDLFCGSEDSTPEDGGAAIWKLQQRELRSSFERVFGVTTSSCNNGWMRGKLLQALGLDSHWVPPREPAQCAELAPAELEPGAEVSRFGRRVRRRKFEESDYESGDDTWVDGSPSPHNESASGSGTSAKGGSGARGGALAKRPRGAAGGPHDAPHLFVGGASGAGHAAAWQALRQDPAGWQVAQHAEQPQVRIVMRQQSMGADGQEGPQVLMVGPSAPLHHPRAQMHGLAQHQHQHQQHYGYTANSPAQQQQQQQQHSALLQAVERMPSSHSLPSPGSSSTWAASSQTLQGGLLGQHSMHPLSAQQSLHPMSGPPSLQPPAPQSLAQHMLPTLQQLHLQQQQQQAVLAAAAALGATAGGDRAAALALDSASLQFYEQQQRLFQMKRLGVEQEKKRELQQRLEALQRQQALAAAVAAVEHQPAQRALQGLALQTAGSQLPHALAQQQQQQQGSAGASLAAFWREHGGALAPPPPVPASGSADTAPLRALSPLHMLGSASSLAAAQAAARASGHAPGGWDAHARSSPFPFEGAALPPSGPRPLPKSFSSELQTLYSAWSDGQLSLNLGGMTG